MEYDLIIGISAFVATYLILKYIFFRKINRVTDYEKELLDILNKDEHKVKRRFE